MRPILLALAVAAVLWGGLFLAPAQALTDADRAAIRGILAEYRSPLPAWTIEAFAEIHPDFDIAGYLAVAWAESSLGRAGRLNNPGSIKGGPVGTVWRDLRIGVTRRGYNIYASMYDGQRALIRLLWERGYNELLRNHEWERFTRIYYGAGVPGRAAYQRTLIAAHNIIVRKAAAYGAEW